MTEASSCHCESRLGNLVLSANDLLIIPADGRTLPHAEGWRIVRSIDPAGPEPRMLWMQITQAADMISAQSDAADAEDGL